MKRYRLWLTPLLALLLVCGLCACGNDNGNADSDSATATNAAVSPVTGDEWSLDDAVFFTFGDNEIAAGSDDGSGYEIDGTALTITAGGAYVVSGSCADGSINVDGGVTGVTLVLDGLDLTAPDTAAITCGKGSQVLIGAAAGSENTLSDSEYNNDDNYPDNENAENAVVKAKDGAQLTLGGSGTLNIYAYGKNGVKGGATSEVGTAVLNVQNLTLNITAVDDGLKSDQELNLLSGNITVSAADDAIKSDLVLNIGAAGSDGPTVLVSESNEGIEAATVNIYSGNVAVHATDDGINAANSDLTDYSFACNIAGGTVYVDVSDGDAIDSNGALTISGGTVLLFAAAPQNDGAPLDCDGALTISGGTVLAVGSGEMAQTPNGTPQAYAVFGGRGGSALSVAAGDTLAICDENGDVILSTTAVRAADYVFFSGDALTTGQAYTLTVNGTVAATATVKENGVADLGAVPGQAPDGQPGAMPGGQSGQMTPEGTPPEPPEGAPQGTPPQGTPPEGVAQ